MDSVDHEQHIRAIHCRSRFESQRETLKFDPPWIQHYWGIQLKFGRINYLTERRWSGRWGEIYTTWDFLLPTFFSTRTGHTSRQTAALSVPKHMFTCKEVPFWGLVDNLPFRATLEAKTPNFGAPDRKRGRAKRLTAETASSIKQQKL